MAEVSKRIIRGLSEKSLDGSHGDRATSHYCIEFPKAKTATQKNPDNAKNDESINSNSNRKRDRNGNHTVLVMVVIE